MSKVKLTLVIMVALLGCGLLWITCTVLGTTCGVVQRTMNPDNVIFNYEWFHDVHKQVLAQQQNVQVHKRLLKEEEDKSEKKKLRVELAGMEQICRSLVQKYNANSLKLNRKLFKESNLPHSLDMLALCQ